MPRKKKLSVGDAFIKSLYDAESMLDYYEEEGEEQVVWVVNPQDSFSGPCTECDGMQGMIFDIEDARGRIPAHFNCVCEWVSIDDYTGEEDEE